MPDMLDMPAMPDMPDIPDIPDMPDMPDMPVMKDEPREPAPDMYVGIGACMLGLKLCGEKLLKGLSMHGFRRSRPLSQRFFFDLVDILRLRVWIPSFFIVSGRFT